MPRRLHIVIGISVAVALTILAPLAPTLWQSRQDKPAVAYLADSGKLQAAYSRWVAQHEAAGGDRKVVLALRWSKGLSVEFSRASGQATLDLIAGTVAAEIRGLPGDGGWELWLVNNRPGPGRSVMPEPGDRLLLAGPLTGTGDVRRLDARLAPGSLADFEIDMVMVTRAGTGDPGKRGVLYGSPELFQRLYTRARLGRPLLTDEDASNAAHASSAVASFDHLIVQGARLFFE